MVANTDQTKSPVERLTDLLTLAINLTSSGNRSPEQVDQLHIALNIFIRRLLPNIHRELHPDASQKSKASNDISLMLVLCGQATELAMKNKRTDEEINELMDKLQKFKELPSVKKERECVMLDTVRGMQPIDGKPCSPQACSHYPYCKGSENRKPPKN